MKCRQTLIGLPLLNEQFFLQPLVFYLQGLKKCGEEWKEIPLKQKLLKIWVVSSQLESWFLNFFLIRFRYISRMYYKTKCLDTSHTSAPIKFQSNKLQVRDGVRQSNLAGTETFWLDIVWRWPASHLYGCCASFWPTTFPQPSSQWPHCTLGTIEFIGLHRMPKTECAHPDCLQYPDSKFCKPQRHKFALILLVCAFEVRKIMNPGTVTGHQMNLEGWSMG